ncbi:response regulator [Photobacterium frigidiphilum]|uniref:response regulator n=1 Tax=Photobacterium frigidiphilum TaxID=264736 RepID=UPI003D0D1B95
MLQKKFVLVVDDSAIIQQTTKLILQKCGFTANHIQTSTNASDAMKMCQTHCYDIIFIDFNLGFGSTGLQLLERLHQSQIIKHNPLIFIITADDSQPVFMGFSEYEPDDYLVKPLRIEVLHQRLAANFKQHQLNNNVFTAFKSDGIQGARKALQQATTQPAFQRAITALCKSLVNNTPSDTLTSKSDVPNNVIPTAISLLRSFTQKHHYLPAQLYLAELYLNQQQYTEAKEIIEQLQDQHPNHLLIIEFSARLALYRGDITQTYQYWVQAHSMSQSNLERLFGMIWLELTLHPTAELLRHLREAANHLHHSIWDNKNYYCLLAWGLLQQNPLNKTISIERMWCKFTQQKGSTAIDRPFVFVLQAWQAARSGNTFIAYRYLQRIEPNDQSQISFEFHTVLFHTYRLLGMKKPMLMAFKQLKNLVISETRLTHQRIKQAWINTIESSLSNETHEYQHALALYKQQRGDVAGQSIFALWPDNRFDTTLARCLIEIWCKGQLNVSQAQREIIMEARWVFESQSEMSNWYQDLQTKYSILHTPVELMTTKGLGHITTC